MICLKSFLMMSVRFMGVGACSSESMDCGNLAVQEESSLLQMRKEDLVSQPSALLVKTPTLNQDRADVSTFEQHIYSQLQAREVASDIILLQDSTTKVFPLELVKVNYFSSANTSYLDILSPNLTSLETYFPYSQDEVPFFLEYQSNLILRIGSLSLLMSLAQDSVSGGQVHQTYLEYAEAVNFPFRTNKLPFVQGFSKAWREDAFAGQLIGHTLLASLLERTEPDLFVLDLTSECGEPKTPVQKMKRTAMAQLPSVLLKARGYIKSSTSGPVLVKVEVENPTKKGEMLTFDAKSGTAWDLAKMVLFAEALYIMECFHTGLHLFAGAAVSAIKKSLPAGSLVGQAVKPQTVMVLVAFLEEAALLHANHSSAFDGTVWPTDNITQVWETTMDMARFYTEWGPEHFLGMTESSPEWWTGGSASFVQPIGRFARVVAGSVVETNEQHLESFQDELEKIGLVAPSSSLDVTGKQGMAKFLENLLFAAGICHTHMYSLREFFTPLMGWVSTEEFFPFLSGEEQTGGLEAILTQAFPSIPDTLLQGFSLSYGTASGFSSKSSKVPQLGDGPYYVDADSKVGHAVSEFQQDMQAAREEVYGRFGSFRWGDWVPGYFYPELVDVPFGFGITQTAYV